MPLDNDQPDSTPPPLEYFAAHEPARVRAHGLTFWALVLVAAVEECAGSQRR